MSTNRSPVDSEAEGDPEIDLGGNKFDGVDRMISQKKTESTTAAAAAVESKYGQVHNSKVVFTSMFIFKGVYKQLLFHEILQL